MSTAEYPALNDRVSEGLSSILAELQELQDRRELTREAFDARVAAAEKLLVGSGVSEEAMESVFLFAEDPSWIEDV